MKKRNRLFVMASLGPALLCFAVMFAYPLVRTILMSLYRLPSLSSRMEDWEYLGLQNYSELFKSSVFIASLKNIALIWLVGGALTLPSLCCSL